SVLRDFPHSEPGDSPQIRPDEMVGENVRVGAAHAQLLEHRLCELMKGIGFVQVVSCVLLSHGLNGKKLRVFKNRETVVDAARSAASARLPPRIPRPSRPQQRPDREHPASRWLWDHASDCQQACNTGPGTDALALSRLPHP